MPIFYEPQYGMPVEIPDGRENDFLQLGYRREPPQNPQDRPPTKKEEEIKIFSPVADHAPPGAGFIQVNSASLKELSENLGLSTAQAKDLQKGRPYKTVEDLIAKIPGVSWVTLNSLISYELDVKKEEAIRKNDVG
jgi:hypothetical protein